MWESERGSIYVNVSHAFIIYIFRFTGTLENFFVYLALTKNFSVILYIAKEKYNIHFFTHKHTNFLKLKSIWWRKKNAPREIKTHTHRSWDCTVSLLDEASQKEKELRSPLLLQSNWAAGEPREAKLDSAPGILPFPSLNFCIYIAIPTHD